MEMLAILTLLLAVMLAVERPKEGFGGLMPISDTEIMAQHLNTLSDDDLSSGNKLLNELKALILHEQRLRAVVPLKEHNEEWMEKYGGLLQQLKDAIDRHIRIRNGTFFEELDWKRDQWGDLEIEPLDDEGEETLEEAKKSYEDVIEKAEWLSERGFTYDIQHFMDTGDKKRDESIDAKKMLGIEGKTSRCELCYKDTFHLSDYEKSWQEMPGAPVQPAYYYYSCACCGFQIYQRGKLSENVCGMDLAGQPLYANMTTEEVASMYDDDYY